VTDQRPSLILITVDCLRADHCGFYGYSRPTTPFLDSLSSESLVVPTAVVAGAPTYYSFPTIFAARMPLALGRDVLGLAPGEETLATTLRQAGYATAAFSAANPYLSPRFGYEQGFELFRDFLDFDAPSIQGDQKSCTEKSETGNGRERLNRWLKKSARAVGLTHLYEELYFQYRLRVAAAPAPNFNALRRFPSADVLVDSAQSWLATIGSRPFFLWIHFMDAHSPYYPQADAFRQLTGRKISPGRARYLNEFWNRSDLPPSALYRHKEAVVELYDSGIRWVDSQIARLVNYLKRSNRWDECVFSLTADHGEEFLEHGRRYHAPVSMVEELDRAPLLFRVPGQPKVKLPPLPFSHLHLAPTLLEILDVPPPSAFQGRSLWRPLQQEAPPDAPSEPVIAECVYGCTNPFLTNARLSSRLLSVRDSRHKLVIRLEPGGVEEIYDLQDDPAEQHPLASDRKTEVRRRLLLAAERHVKKTRPAGAAELALKARLRNLRLELGE
jgi:arylsulfatase A-like enzyme